MARKRKSKKATENSTTTNMLVGIQTDELKLAIIEAILESENKKKKIEQEQKEKEVEEYRRSLGYKDYPQFKGCLKKVFILLNRIKIFLTYIFFSKKKVKEQIAVVSFFKTLLCIVFNIAMICCFLLFVMFIYSIFVSEVSIWLKIPRLIGAISLLFLSGIFRLISIEVDMLEDYNFLFGIFASVVSMISVIVAVIAFVKE